MKSYFIISGVALLPALLTGILYLIETKTKFSKIPYWIQQAVFGIFFGGLAILGTEFGIPIAGAQVNCRDGAVITAGLFFGAPAGIIAGLIGGIERWFAVYWGIGTFTRLACTISTILAGFISAGLRKFVFENHRPKWLLSFLAGIVIEVIHMTMIFVTNMDTPKEAIAVVVNCTLIMLAANGFSVLASAVVMTLVSKKQFFNRHRKPLISTIIQKSLVVLVSLAFFITSFFVYRLQNTLADTSAVSLLNQSIEDVKADVQDAIRDNSDRINPVQTIANNRHISEDGFILIRDLYGKIVSEPTWFNVLDLTNQIDTLQNQIINGSGFMTVRTNKEDYLVKSVLQQNYYIYACIPYSTAYLQRDIALYVNMFLEIIVFGLLFCMIYILIQKAIVKPLQKVNISLEKITAGNLEERVPSQSNHEFESLSEDINKTVDTLNRYIDEASKRIDEELKLAKSIQESALPKLTSVITNHAEFEISAFMSTAKEVGGDFYDFYLTDDKLNFLIADVSGKGIPAAMFMMRSKTELRTLTESGLPLNQVFTQGNQALCEGNDADMFVTAWQGQLDFHTGLIQLVNAGHNPPLLRKADGSTEFLKFKKGFVLAGMEGLQYSISEFHMEKDDILLLYTDGVTEATNKEQELYGEERLEQCFRSLPELSMEEICKKIKEDVDSFVGDAPQFDDITMVALKYRG